MISLSTKTAACTFSVRFLFLGHISLASFGEKILLNIANCLFLLPSSKKKKEARVGLGLGHQSFLLDSMANLPKTRSSFSVSFWAAQI
jgi:hypothetical protein